MKKCPKCGSTRIETEKRLDGKSQCIMCMYQDKSARFEDKTATKEELQTMEPVSRVTRILEIDVIEKLIPINEGVDLNEGYKYEVAGSLPQLADGLAKLALELDKDKALGENVGGALITLISNYYELGRSDK